MTLVDMIQKKYESQASYVGPLDDHVYWFPGSFSSKEYSAAIMSGDTYAPTPEKPNNMQ